ncbi:hypothetical protein FRB96_003479 [Tulasnella sp. 330]|nr:hypothetical protein FRB96_003479 [Tulasnella sp. 330]KAG8890292.1 hypothetical protein FRB98_009359 [Tulasnella sp. 332]
MFPSPSSSRPPSPAQTPFGTPPQHFIDLRIPVDEDVSLQAILKVPITDSNLNVSRHSNSVAIISHPWSWLGGSMHDQVLHNLSEVFLKLDYHVILFNTRGVGESSGRSSFTGIPESQDLRAALGWAVEEIANLHTAVLVGYSYGSLITSIVPSPIQLYPGKIKRAAHILISYPLGPMASFLTFFNTPKYTAAFDKVLADPELDVLLVYGNQDQFFSTKKYGAWSTRCREIRTKAVTESSAHPGDHDEAELVSVQGSNSPVSTVVSGTNANDPTKRKRPMKLEVKMLNHGDHFWRGGNGKRLSKTVSEWVERLQPLHPEFSSD